MRLRHYKLWAGFKPPYHYKKKEAKYIFMMNLYIITKLWIASVLPIKPRHSKLLIIN